jgi:CO/xanthine dehydrogenase Mo-binding subunit
VLSLAEKYSVVGRSVPKIDGGLKVTGMARYIDDIELPNMLYGKILRSRHPHAKILRINTERAWRVPGVRAVITGLDTPFNKMGVLKDQPPLKLTKLGRLGTRLQLLPQKLWRLRRGL